MVEQEAVNFEVAGSSPAPGAKNRFFCCIIIEMREVKAGARRDGYEVIFFEVGGKKYRLDFLTCERRKDLPSHFGALEKIVHRGGRGDDEEKWMVIWAELYARGLIRVDETVRVKGKGIGGAEKGMKKLVQLEKHLAIIYGEEREMRCNEVTVSEQELETEEGFEGLGAEENFYREVLLPEVERAGGQRKQIIPQLEFCSLFPEESRDKRRVDFFVTNGKGGMVVELDDYTHIERSERDEERDKLVRAHRMRVLRIGREELSDAKKVRRKLRKVLKGFYDVSSKASEERIAENAIP